MAMAARVTVDRGGHGSQAPRGKAGTASVQPARGQPPTWLA
jgi:hypothetical protein